MSRFLYILKNYGGFQKAFVYVGYIFQYILNSKFFKNMNTQACIPLAVKEKGKEHLALL